MSLFGALMGFGDMDEDPLFGGHVRRMNHMMNSFFQDPFSDMMMGGPMMANQLTMGQQMQPPRRGQQQMARMGEFPLGGLMPFPNMFPMNPMGAVGAPGMTSMSSTVMTMSQGPDGRPQVYQASTSMRQGPDGVRETKKTVADTRTGLKKMSIGHHIYDRGHVIEREQNVYSGDHEERQEFINLEEDEADEFNQEWQTKTRGTAIRQQIGNGHQGRRHKRDHQQLALPSNVPEQNQSNLRQPRPPPRRSSYYTTSNQLPSTAAMIAQNQGECSSKKRRSEIYEVEEPDELPKHKINKTKKTQEIIIEEVTTSDDEVEEVQSPVPN